MNNTLIILLPLIGFFINGVWHLISAGQGKKTSPIVSGAIATLAMALSFAFAIIQFFKLRAMPVESRLIEETLFQWMKLGGLSVDFALRFDSLSSVFTLVITGVGTLIHLYSVGYMSDEENIAKYFAYLNFFCFMMLNLVLGSTLPHVFLGWEGVGLASYLLIGFWYKEMPNVLAGQKAFIMNRIGDLGFLIAMFIGFKFAGTLDLIEIQKAVLSPHVVTVFGLLIFLACTGKSAQIPLFTWLPDAMAGPTPVSALIHAATMVTSGVYLLARLNPIIASSELVLSTIAIVGGLTALVAAIIACFQSDLKKVLAYSTVSQLGFMFMACGVGAFQVGVFHVMTHAFFKALLFLAAGSVIHALHGEQNIFEMGGLRKKLPVTFITFTAGWAAILGLPPFSGFFSKDEIIYETLVSHHGNKIIFSLAIISAALTAFYMTRLYLLVFFGSARMDKKKFDHAHESPWVMGAPLAVLAILSLIGGWFGAPVSLEHGAAEASEISPHLIMFVSVVIATLGAGLAFFKYSKNTKVEKTTDVFGIDRIYGVVFGQGLQKLSSGASKYLEEWVVQRIIQVSAALVDLSGNMIKVLQVGSAQAYLMMIVLAVVAIFAWFFLGAGIYGNF
jgi:NADH-quinone oxidoreductase subunit L